MSEVEENGSKFTLEQKRTILNKIIALEEYNYAHKEYTKAVMVEKIKAIIEGELKK